MKKKLTKEEKLAKLERREKLKGFLGGAIDLEAVNALVTDLRKEIIEMMYDEELKNHLDLANMIQDLKILIIIAMVATKNLLRRVLESLIYQCLEIETESLSRRL